MSTTRIQISFNNLLYPIDVSSSTPLSKAQKLLIQTTEQGFHLTSDHSPELEYQFTYQPHHTPTTWRVVCLIGDRNIKSFIQNDNLTSMWTTLRSDEQWLIYGQATTIGSLMICCLSAISLWFSMDYQSFSNRDLKVLTASSFALTWLNLFFVYDTSTAISENSYTLIHTLISVVNSLKTPQEESIEILEDECDLEASQNDSLARNRLSAISRQIKSNQSEIQKIQQQIREYRPNSSSRNPSIHQYQKVSHQPPLDPGHQGPQNPPFVMSAEEQAKNEKWNQLMLSAFESASSRLNRNHNQDSYSPSLPPLQGPILQNPPSHKRTKL